MNGMSSLLLERYMALPDEVEEMGAEIADITARWIEPAAAEQVARDVERTDRAAGRPFPRDLVPLLSLSGIGIHWIMPGARPVGGELFLADFLAQWAGPPLATDVRDRADGGDPAAVLADACWFDTHPSGDGAATILDRATGRLWFQKQGTLFPMFLDPAAYLARAVECRGIGNWQYVFADVPRTYFDHAYVGDRTREALAELERLFPDVDTSAWRADIETRFGRG